MAVAPEPLAAQTAKRVFEEGGNAVDAAVAVSFAQCAVDPLMCSLGGSALMQVRLADGASVVIDGSVTIGSVPPPSHWVTDYSGRSETIGRYIVKDESNQIGYTSACIPGFVGTTWRAYRKYGSGNVSWARLLDPAIQFAEEGFTIYPYIGKWLRPGASVSKPGYPDIMTKLTYCPESRRIYLKDGRPYQEGEILVQSDMAKTLRILARDGGDVFYSGDIGKAIAHDFETHGGLFNYEDLANWQPLDFDPVQGSYGGYEIASAPAPAGSGVQMVEMLSIAECFPLASMDPNDPVYIDLLAKIMRFGFYDNVLLKGDPPLSLACDMIKRFCSKEHAHRLASLIKSGQSYPGPLAQKPADTGTTHVTTIDSDLNAVSFTHTQGSAFGSGAITPGLGFLYNNFMGHFNPLPGAWDSIVPGKKGGGGCPVVVSQNGGPVLVLGSPGGSRLTTSAFQTILNVLDHKMDAQTAVSVPRFHCEENNLLFIEPQVPEETVSTLRGMGWKIIRSTYMARMQAIAVKDGQREFAAGADPRGGQGVSYA